LDTPEPALLSHNVNAVLSMMRSAGFNGTTLYFGAHSLGTVFLQDFCASNACAGQVLTGGFLARTHYYPTFSYKVPTLTLGGSLDGLARVTRTVAESYYQQITIAGKAADFPVVRRRLSIRPPLHWRSACALSPSAFSHCLFLPTSLCRCAGCD
jgi:hypothetical protein